MRIARREPTRLLFVTLLALAMSGPGCDGRDRPQVDTSPDALRRLRRTLHEQAVQWLKHDQLARPDGYVYAIDVTQLAIYAAQTRDADLFRPLRRRIVDRLIVERNGHTFVAWRYHPNPDKPLDASGTTEALRAAKALWLGAGAFERHTDRPLALAILRGYAAHATVDQDVWLIRNYYNLGTNAYATNSYLVDYAPDFVQRVADAADDEALRETAQRSAQLVRRAAAPSGLLRQVIQPELATLMPGKRVIFSPNGIEQLSNTATVAERSARTCPDVARRVLRFVQQRWPDVHGYYDARTGAPRGEARAGLATMAPLLRLAVRLDHDAMRDRLLRPVVRGARQFSDKPRPPRLYMTGEALLALQAVIDAPIDAAPGSNE